MLLWGFTKAQLCQIISLGGDWEISNQGDQEETERVCADSKADFLFAILAARLTKAASPWDLEQERATILDILTRI